MEKNYIIKSDEGFLTTKGAGWSKEYPDAWLMTEGEADRTLADLESCFPTECYNPDEPMQIIRDYGTEDETVVYEQEDPREQPDLSGMTIDEQTYYSATGRGLK